MCQLNRNRSTRIARNLPRTKTDFIMSLIRVAEGIGVIRVLRFSEYKNTQTI